jgi:hypothetical protein
VGIKIWGLFNAWLILALSRRMDLMGVDQSGANLRHRPEAMKLVLSGPQIPVETTPRLPGTRAVLRTWRRSTLEGRCLPRRRPRASVRLEYPPGKTWRLMRSHPGFRIPAGTVNVPDGSTTEDAGDHPSYESSKPRPLRGDPAEVDSRTAKGPPSAQVKENKEDRPGSTLQVFPEDRSDAEEVTGDQDPSLFPCAEPQVKNGEGRAFVDVESGRQGPDGEVHFFCRRERRPGTQGFIETVEGPPDALPHPMQAARHSSGVCPGCWGQKATSACRT